MMDRWIVLPSLSLALIRIVSLYISVMEQTVVVSHAHPLVLSQCVLRRWIASVIHPLLKCGLVWIWWIRMCLFHRGFCNGWAVLSSSSFFFSSSSSHVREAGEGVQKKKNMNTNKSFDITTLIKYRVKSYDDEKVSHLFKLERSCT